MQEITAIPVGELKVEDVAVVYSGRPGCGCGCRGKYWVNPAWLAQATKRRGYEYAPEEISLQQVRRVLGIIQRRASEVEVVEDAKQTIYYIEDGTRFYWVFVYAKPEDDYLAVGHSARNLGSGKVL